jgi:hypothetical protein
VSNFSTFRFENTSFPLEAPADLENDSMLPFILTPHDAEALKASPPLLLIILGILTVSVTLSNFIF